jgi:hypothetical protein
VQNEIANALTLAGGGMKLGGRKPGSRARQLYECPRERRLCAEGINYGP